jgi:hypothetical protein
MRGRRENKKGMILFIFSLFGPDGKTSGTVVICNPRENW